MISPSDDDYQRTKKLRKGGGVLPSPFRELAQWVAARYAVSVLDVQYEIVLPDRLPRFQVVLEWGHDLRKFLYAENFNEARQLEVESKFLSLIQNQKSVFKTDGLFVTFSSFEAVARWDAHDQVTQEELSRLKSRLSPDLWEISRAVGCATFMFYTQAQAEAATKSGLQDIYAREYFKLLARHDEFGYFAKSGVTVFFDSKERFDKVYGGSWFAYYR